MGYGVLSTCRQILTGWRRLIILHIGLRIDGTGLLKAFPCVLKGLFKLGGVGTGLRNPAVISHMSRCSIKSL